MILEISQVRILPGKETEFERLFYEACEIISTVRGYRGASLEKSLDNLGLYYMMLKWETMENHLSDFPNSAEAARAMPLLLPLFDGMPKADHVVRVETPRTA